MFLGLVAAFASQAADYTLDFRDATPVASEAPVLRKAEMPLAVGQIPSVAVGDSLDLQLFDDVAVLVDVADTLPEYLGGKAYSLTLGDGVCGSTLIENAEGLLLELRDIEACRLYSISVRDGRAYIEETDLSLARRGGCIEVETPELDADGEGSDAASTTKRRLLGAVPGNPFDDNIVAPAPVTVDIMLVFDIGAQTWVEKSTKYSSITNFAIAQVAKMNQVLRNTDLHTNFWYRLVDVATVDSRWTVIDKTVLPAMRTGIMESSGIWGEVATRREACGADVVSLIIDTGSAYGTTGIGYITHGTTYDKWVNSYRSWCYSCCAIRSVENDYTLSHEVGHNMGLTHSPTLANWSKSGTFDYCNGYNFTGGDGKHYNTVMAYNYDQYYSDYIEIPYFSSPLHTYAGVPVGTAISNDCTRALRQTCRGIADWHTQTIPLPSDVVFSPSANDAFIPPASVTLSTLGGYDIHYTIDGSEPTRESPIYVAPISFTTATTIKAIAIVDEERTSPIFVAEYNPVATGTTIWLDVGSGGEPVNWTTAGWLDEKNSETTGLAWPAAGDYVAYLRSAPTVNVDSPVTLKALVYACEEPITINADANNISAASIDVLGKGVIAGTNYSFTDWKLHPNSSLTIAPGEGKILDWTKAPSMGDSTARLVVSNGTLQAKTSGSTPGCFGSGKIEIANGGVLKIVSNWQTGLNAYAPLTVDAGGILEVDAIESLNRNLVLNGGTVKVSKKGRMLEFDQYSKLTVTEDSSFEDASADSAGLYIRKRHLPVTVAEGKKLTMNIPFAYGAEISSNTEGFGLIKDGPGEIILKKESTFDGPTIISNGTFTVDYDSTTSRGRGFTICEGAILRIAPGASTYDYKTLTVPSLDCRGTIALNDVVSLYVDGAVDVAQTIFKLETASKFTDGSKIMHASSFSGMDLARVEGKYGFWYLSAESDGYENGGYYLVLREAEIDYDHEYGTPYTVNIPAGISIEREWAELPWLDSFSERVFDDDWNGIGSASISVNADSTLKVSSYVNITGDLSFEGSATVRLDCANGFNTGSLTIGSGVNLAIDKSGSADVKIGTLTASSSDSSLSVMNGVVSATVNGTINAAINVESGATLRLYGSGRLAGKITLNGGSIEIAGSGDIDLQGAVVFVTEDSSLHSSAGGGVRLAGSSVKFAVDGGKTFKIACPVSHSASTDISKTGTGTVELNGYNGNELSFSGETIVNGGFYLVNATHVNNGARYNITGSGTLAGIGAITGSSDTWVSTGGVIAGSLALNNLRLETGATIGSSHYPAADVVYGKLNYEAKSGVTTPITIDNGSLTVAEGCDVSGFSAAPIAISSDAALVLSNDLTVATVVFDAGARLVADGMLTVSSAVDVSGAIFSFTPEEGQVFEHGFSKPIISSSSGFSGYSRLSTEALPELSAGLAWVFKVQDGTLCAKVVTEEEASSAVAFVSNSPTLTLEETTAACSVMGLDTKAIAVTLEVVVTNANDVVRHELLSLGIGTKATLRCYRDSDNMLKCRYTNDAYQNSVTPASLQNGTNTLIFAYYSYDNDDYGGTFVYLNGQLVYRGARLRWSNDFVKSLTIANDWLEIRKVAVVDLFATTPLPNMTASGAAVTYSYPTNTFPNVFGLLPDGAFELTNSVVKANFDVTNTAASISFVASFPESATGALCGLWVIDARGDLALAAEYLGDGAFDFRYHGYSWDQSDYVNSIKPYTATYVGDSAVSDPHLYTITLSQSEGIKLYQDGELVAHMFTGSTAVTLAQNMRFVSPFLFGQGPRGIISTMPSLTVYASHIAFGTSDPAASADVVKATLPVDEPDTPDDPEPPETPAVVDVLVAYDNGGEEYVSGKGRTLEEFAQTQIDRMNDVLATNRLDRFYSYRLAGTCKVDATYANVNEAVTLITAGAGPCVSLRAARELYGADLVSLLVNSSIEYLGHSSPLTQTTDVASCHEDAFSVCAISAVDSNSQYTMIHEIAHNMGCGHSRNQSQNPGPSVFPYGSGYYFNDNGTQRHTIMAYGANSSPYFSTTSSEFGFTLGDKTNNNARVLKETCAEVAKWREGAAIDIDGVEVGGVTWKTSALYPWSVEGDAIRSFNQTNYQYQCTTPLRATIEGPKVLRFKHKSYFGGESVAGSNYSHFDVLLDDSPVLTQTECTNEWTEAYVDVPEGTHEVTFVFSQRFAMNNPSDYKEGEPDADDAVWLKDLALNVIPHSLTSDDVSWTFPADAVSTTNELDGIEIKNAGIVETLGFSTNAVVLSVLAELPQDAEGAFIGLIDAKDSSRHQIYAYANGDGTVIIYFDNKAKTNDSQKSDTLDLSVPHVWTLVYCATDGAYLYMDGKEVASDISIKWTGNNNLHTPTECVAFGSDCDNLYPLAGMKIYAVDSDFGLDAFSNATNTPANNASAILSQFACLADYADESLDNKLALLSLYNETGSIPDQSVKADSCVLRISEIMPKPTDAQNHGALEGMDVNGLESGWVEVENTSDQWADLADYRFIRVNRGKKTDPAGVGNFPSRLVPPRGRAIFYTSERYSNSKDKTVSAFAEGTFDGKPMIFEDYGNILVWGDKVNPKKSPYVRLYYAPVSNASNIVSVVDTVVIPSDLPEGWSIIVGDAEEGEGTRRWMCPTPTRGAANTATTGLTRIGPNVGPLYEKPDQKKTDLASEFAVITPPAVPGTDYTVTLPVNAVMNPDGTFVPRDADVIQSIKFVYRKDLDDTTLVTNNIDMAAKTTDANWGDQYTATIPASYFPAAGHLMQWKVLITDGEGVEWTSPSFNNKDDGYEWYGTIVEPNPTTQMSATLPTWHMFASGNHLAQMDVDADEQDLSLVPNQARVAIYDSSTSNYYDYVRIDLRGHTSASFTKKGHGLRFAKAHPLTMRDIVSGEDIEDVRKTSLISEFADPSFMRQMIAFWLWRKMGNLVPFDFPVRCNLNGEFYQLAFNSERFTDELIEDFYKLDKFGYGYKNVGTLKSGSDTTAGSIEKKTPDDEDETNITVLQNELRKPLKDNGAQSGNEDIEALTKFVVQKFDLPAWINYLASARITQEMDDVWANVCAYYDNPTMKKGARGTGTWMPLGYDFNLSFGQYYYGDLNNTARFGLSANQDWFKSHPLYGGNRIVAHKKASNGEAMNGNDGFESIYQSAKFRRLYLRRLRTLMDQELKEPGTPESEVQFMVKMREMADLMRADSVLDLAKWPDDSSDNAIDVWPSGTRPANMDEGIDEIWNDYVVPRRQHLYVTHSATNTAKAIGYGSNLNAGIPEAQSPISVLAQNFVIAKLSDCVVISNLNNEVVDMSGWTLKFGVEWTLPAGTVCDSNDCIYVVADRRSYIEAHNAELTDQVIVGNATFSDWSAVYFDAADGTVLRGVSSDDSVVTFEAKDQKAADKLVAELSPALTEEDATAGLQAKYLKVVAEPTGNKNEFVVAVAVNPETVNAPVIAEPAAESEPVEIEEDDKGETTVSVSISNAVKGLWYGYEVADELGDASSFENDVPSFERATDAAHTVTGSSRTQPSGFFRLKVLPAKPSE